MQGYADDDNLSNNTESINQALMEEVISEQSHLLGLPQLLGKGLTDPY